MNLSQRLTKVKNTVINCETVCDIGCDHGFVSISLIKEGKAKRVIACDINKGPLEAAKENVSKEDLSNQIELRLSDGLSQVTLKDKPDSIVIAGMGGALMCKILTEGSLVASSANQLVLQPQSEIFLVRKWLRENGFYIENEEFLKDMGKFYVIMDARPGKSEGFDSEIQEFFDIYSKNLIDKKDNLYKEYLLWGIEKNSGYLAGITGEKRDELERKIILMKKAVSMME
ncbi:MAG: SAM-dependent methyltransferase [Lachnospiraceae bacterium]|nr:SAM-dependent methyltransferase [Lachnospiraceae bacterium]